MLKDFIDFNPRETLPKGQLAKKVAMEKLRPFCRDIEEFEVAKYSGGTKFRNGDTLLARITPCLENGKTAQVRFLNDGEVGFGSTEYIVLRAKEGVSDSDYIYYLSTSPKFREIAIQSMVGSSGRQRVQQDVLEKAELHIPPLDEQRKIAGILSALDDKIELNNKINRNLEAQAQAIFKSWFIAFEPFKNGKFIDSELGKIPEGWDIGTIGDISIISTGKRPDKKSVNKSNETPIPIIGASSIMGYTNKVLYDEKILITGRVGTHGIIQKIDSPCWPSDNTLVLRSKNLNFLHNCLLLINWKSMNRGSTQPLITQNDLKNIRIILPQDGIIQNYEQLVHYFDIKFHNNNKEIYSLSQIRDLLLPKLMSGELTISDYIG